MTAPDTAPLRIHAGSSWRRTFPLLDAHNADAPWTPEAGDDFVLRILGPDGTQSVRASVLRGEMSIETIDGKPHLVWPQTVLQSRAVRPNSTFEIEARRGYAQVPLRQGVIQLTAGSNDDEP